MILGIYGTIGSGKSLSAKYIAKNFNYTYLDLDEVAKMLMQDDEQLIIDLINLQKQFNFRLINNDYSINKQGMTRAIFDNKKTNREVSQIIWHYLSNYVQDIIDVYKEENLNLVIEASILPALNLKNIDTYIEIKDPSKTNVFNKLTSYGKKLTLDKNKTSKQLERIISIQNKLNKKHKPNYLIINNIKDNDINNLYKQINNIFK